LENELNKEMVMVLKFIKKHSKKLGFPPGTATPVGISCIMGCNVGNFCWNVFLF